MTANRTVLTLCLSFTVGLLLVTLPLLGWGDSPASSALLAPVLTQPSPTVAAQIYLPTPLPDVELPDGARICLEPFGERFDVFGTVQDQGKTTYLLGLYSDFVTTNPLDASDEVIVVDPQQGCDRVIDSTSTRRPLSSYVSAKAAESLELQRYQQAIAQLGSLHAFQQSLTAHINAEHGLYLLSAEQVNALKQLHVSFPNTYRLLADETFPTSEP
ncbi:hypothetical protein IQ273_10335 [Nodosilinea sp. LEGE 07298]|uniref:hypothetical protein n=1 Tax=Nodosilinea sp. LEGE 07298 TaxID=2777970 RepID=UPI0018800C1B|nr:hypothetical protein [Nodosilinea sp. LEGE 07298]MBE9109808.1 hypothetical protein [Nodosilinea sp. LEGE 07298]